MKPEFKNPSPHPNRRKVGAAMLLAVLALLALATRQPLAAEEQRVITTIIPFSVVTPDSSAGTVFTSQNPVLLRFRKDALPKNAPEGKATLRLINDSIGESAAVNIQAYFLPEDPGWDGKALQNVTRDKLHIKNSSFGARYLDSVEPSKSKPWAEWVPTELPPALKDGSAGQRSDSFALLLLPSNPNDRRQWHSISAPSQNRPRLILEYTVPGRAAAMQAEGGPAMHSPKPFLPTPGAQLITTRVTTDNLWSFAPASYKGLVYVTIIDKDSRFYLQTLSPLGGQPLWSSDPLGKPGQHLVVSESGRLYIVGQDKILVYQLDPSKASQAATAVKTSGGQPPDPSPVENLNPTLAPAVAPDGSLYFVNDMQVYGLNPDLQELWKVTLAGTLTSGVTVGPSGRFVYLLAKNEGLIAIDAQTGEYFSRPLPNQGDLESFDKPTLHAPVVIRHPDGREKIYVAANAENNGVLALFDNYRTQAGKSESGEIIAVKKWKPLVGLWSQPIIDQSSPAEPSKPAEANKNKKLYAVRVDQKIGTLTAIDWLDGSNKAMGSPFEPDDSPYLLSGNLAMDQAGSVLVWAREKTALNAFKSPGSVEKLVLTESTVLSAESRLLFGLDGTLYALDPGNLNERALRAVVPHYTLGAGTVAQCIANPTVAQCIHSPTHLHVDGNVEKNTTLSAAGSVLLGNGTEFIVRKGTTFTVRTNVQQAGAGK